MAAAPHAFLSYTRLDDEFHGGAITALRKQLEMGVRMVTGDRTFTIFQDIEGIEFGQHWPSRLDEALASARFLIPVLSQGERTRSAGDQRGHERVIPAGVLALAPQAGR